MLLVKFLRSLRKYNFLLKNPKPILILVLVLLCVFSTIVYFKDDLLPGPSPSGTVDEQQSESGQVQGTSQEQTAQDQSEQPTSSSPLNQPSPGLNLGAGEVPIDPKDLVTESEVKFLSELQEKGIFFQIQQSGPYDKLKACEFLIPSGFDILNGSAIGDGTIIGEGKVLWGDNLSIDVEVKNIGRRLGHEALWQINYLRPNRSIIMSYDSFLNKNAGGGYIWKIERSPFFEVALPVTFEVTLYLSAAGKEIIRPLTGDVSNANLKAIFLNDSAKTIGNSSIF